MTSRLSLLLICGALAGSFGCAPAAEPPPAQEAADDPCAGLNTLTDSESADGWLLLFDGSSLNGWHGFNGGSTEAWAIDDCSIRSAGTEDNYGSDERVDVASDGEYTNFELVLDWKATAGGNSGLIYAVVEDPRYKTAWNTGPEYQLMDDASQEKPNAITSTASDYDMLAPSEDKVLNPVGEWNTTKLVVNGAHVEHWLNGDKVVEFERWSDEWKARRDAGKWEYEDYGLAETGRIVLQDHGSEFWFRNIKIREMGADSDGEHSEDDDEDDSEEDHTDSDEDDPDNQ